MGDRHLSRTLVLLGAVVLFAMSAVAAGADNGSPQGLAPDEDPRGFLEATQCEVGQALLPQGVLPECAENETADPADWDRRIMRPMGFEAHPQKDVTYALFSVDNEVRLAAADGHTGERLWGVQHTVGVDGQEPYVGWMDLAVGSEGEFVYVVASASFEVHEGGELVGYESAGVVMALDASDGELTWIRADTSLASPSVVADPLDQRVYVTGRQQLESAEEGHHGLTIKALEGAGGTPVWSTAFNEWHSQSPQSMAFDPETRTVAVIGQMADLDEQGNATQNALVVAVDADDGELRWSDTFEASAAYAEPSIQARDGTVLAVANRGPHLDALDVQVQAYEALTGDPRWSHTYDGPGGSMDWAQELHVTSDTVLVHGVSAVGHDVLVPGVLQGGVRDWDAFVLALDRSDGEENWLTFTEHPRLEFALAADVAVTEDEETVIATGWGYRALSSDTDVLTTSLDMETGEHRWVAYWSTDEIPTVSPNYDAAYYVLLDPDEEHALSLVWTGDRVEGRNFDVVRHEVDRPAGALTYTASAQNEAWNAKR